MSAWKPQVAPGVALALALALVSSSCEPSSEVRPERRNVILIVVDTLRSDYLGCYGGPVPTPTIDALAARGTRFETAYAHIPLTGPSHASIFTSSLPSDHGCTVNSQVFPEVNETMAEILRERGWHTSAFISLGVLRGQFGFAQGFDDYVQGFQNRWWKSADEVNADLFAWLEEREPEPTFLMLHYSDPHSPYAPPDRDYAEVELRSGAKTIEMLSTDSRQRIVGLELAPGVNEFALELLGESERDDVGCGIVRLSDAEVRIQFTSGADVRDIEENYCPFPALPDSIRLTNPSSEPKQVNLGITLHENLSREEIIEVYADEVAYLDSQLNEAIEALKRAGLWESSVIVFTSDHGEGLGQHDHVGHVEQLYDSVLRIPLIVVAPGSVPAGTVVEAPARHIDILPTVLELLDVDVDLEFRGHSLLPYVSDDETSPPPVLAETHRPEAQNDQRALVFDGHKYIVNATTETTELYSLVDDPGELENLVEQRSDLVPILQTILTEEFARNIGVWEGEAELPELTDEERAQLQALGYAR